MTTFATVAYLSRWIAFPLGAYVLSCRFTRRRPPAWARAVSLVSTGLVVLGTVASLATATHYLQQWDFLCFWQYGHAAIAHQNVYQPQAYRAMPLPMPIDADFRASSIEVGFPYPPAAILLFAPLGLTRAFSQAGIAWLVTMFAALVVGTFALASTALRERDRDAIVAIVALVFSVPAVADNVAYHQTNFLAFAAVVAAWQLRDRFTGGIAAGLAVVVKPYLIVAIVWLALRRRWNALVASLATVGGLTLAALPFLGPGGFHDFLFDNPTKRFPTYVYSELEISSLTAALVRVFHATISAAGPLRDPIFLAIAIPTCAVTFLIVARANGRDDDLTFALAIALALALYPASSTMYAIVLVPAFVAFARRVETMREGLVLALGALAFFAANAAGGLATFGAYVGLWLVASFALARRTALAATAIAIAVTGVGGCSRGPAIRETSVVRLVALQDPPGFNPLVTDNADLQDLVPLIHGFLLGADARGNLTPDLVTVVPTVANGGLSRDGLTIRYRLRHGVRWHDGAPFDARDVLFSFRAAMNPANDVPDRSGFDDIASVRAPSAFDVEVRLRHTYSPALATFFSGGANDPYAILPAHLLASQHDINRAPYNGSPIGLGPYRLVSWERGSRIILEADPHFRRGPAKIARVEIRIVTDSNTALTLWQSGALDLFYARGFGGSRSLLRGARTVKNAREVLSDHYQFNYLMFNTASGPLHDVRVRRALVRGIDIGRIQSAVRGELYRPGSGDRLPGQFAYDPSIVQASYDPIAAGKLLDEAGWRMQGGVRMRDGAPLTLQIVGVAGSTGSKSLDVQLQSALQALGIRVDVKDYQYNVLFGSAQAGGIFASGRFDLTSYGWQPGADADHSYLYRCDTRPPNGENYGRICDPIIDRQAAIELGASDPAVAIAADRAMLREIDAQSDVFFMGFDREALFAPKALRGIEPSVLGHHYWNLDRWSWAK